MCLSLMVLIMNVVYLIVCNWITNWHKNKNSSYWKFHEAKCGVSDKDRPSRLLLTFGVTIIIIIITVEPLFKDHPIIKVVLKEG